MRKLFLVGLIFLSIHSSSIAQVQDEHRQEPVKTIDSLVNRKSLFAYYRAIGYSQERVLSGQFTYELGGAFTFPSYSNQELRFFGPEGNYEAYLIDQEGNLLNMSYGQVSEIPANAEEYWYQGYYTMMLRKRHKGIALGTHFYAKVHYYYNFFKRVRKEKDTRNNSANYLALDLHVLPPAYTIVNEYRRWSSMSLSLYPSWGFRRTLYRRWTFEMNFGYGLSYYIRQNSFDFSLLAGSSLKYTLQYD